MTTAPQAPGPHPLPADGPVEPLFDDDRGRLPLTARRALVLLLKSTHLAARSHPAEWDALLTERARVAEVLNELFLVLEIDERAGVAFKTQAEGDGGFNTLLTQRALTPGELRILMRLRELLFEAGGGPAPVTVRGRDLLDHLAQAYPEHRGDRVAARAEDTASLRRLAGDDVLVPARGTAGDDPEEIEYTISPVVLVVMHPDRMAQYAAVLAADGAGEPVDDAEDADDDTGDAGGGDPDADPSAGAGDDRGVGPDQGLIIDLQEGTR